MVKFQIRSYNTFGDMELLSSDRQTQSDTYEPTVQYAQVGSKIAGYPIQILHDAFWCSNPYIFPMLRSAVGKTHDLPSDL